VSTGKSRRFDLNQPASINVSSAKTLARALHDLCKRDLVQTNQAAEAWKKMQQVATAAN
jgi:hypothetical protein